ncbi:TonB-dependent receptor [Sphingomonas sp. Leaf339]|uniref:TonB-dependent receptor n=1 Tax=Sphingomonas sp. Leaf339 TaxID=1736343 RepID=UPI0006F95889|nr:TonB-dependent receptor [Sphingomonas sp. Leaf339]KQU48244.1 TonB-dependent receptor [Sphingomonas sp. Leaf339]
MRLTAYLLSAAATIAIATPALAQEPVPTNGAARQMPSQATANGAVQAESPNAGAPSQDDRDAGGTTAGDIIVTATRRASPLSDVPIAVSAVTQEALQNTGANDIRSLNQLAPSLLVSSTGSEANASARIRGIGTVGDNPGLESSVAVFIDGVYRSRTGVGLNELGEIERVEVLRGPQGTLFGRNASAGLINIVTQSPKFTFGGVAEATYGNYDNYRFVGGLTGPLIGDLLAFRVDGVFNKRDGFYRNVTAANGSESRVNDRDRYFVRGQLLFKPTDAISFRLIGDYTHRNESCCGAVYYSQNETTDPTQTGQTQANGSTVNTDGQFTYGTSNRIVDVLRRQGAVYPLAGTRANPFSREVAVTPGQTYRNKTEDYGGSGQLDWDLGGATLTSITAYRQYKSGNAGDVDYTNVDLTHRAADGNAYRQFKTFTQEVRLNGSLFEGKLDWLVGGFYANEKLKLVDNVVFGANYGAFAACRLVATANPAAFLQNQANPGCLGTTPLAALGGATARQALGANFGTLANNVLGGLDRLSSLNSLGDQRSVYRQDSENYAFFTHNILNITDTLSVTLGLRYTHEQKDFRANFNNNNTICPQQQAALSPLIANAAVPAAARQYIAAIVTLSCTGNSSSTLNALKLNDGFKDGEFTGTGVVSWKPTPRLLTYASYAKGYKAGGYNLDRSDLGGLNGVFAPRSNADAPGLRFDAEKVNAYEIGAKYNIRGAFSLNVAAFRQEFKDFQLNTFNGSVFVVQNIQSCKNNLAGADTDSLANNGTCAGNADKAGVISQGVELEATMNPARHVTFTAGYTYADTHFRKNLVGSSEGEALDPALFLLPGSQLSNAPKNVVTTSFAWTPDIGSNGMSALFYVDSRLTSDYNTGSDLAPEKKQDGFALVNARIGIRGRDQLWALEFWAQNLLNEDYIQVAFNTPFQGAGSIANTQRFGTTANALYSSFLAEPRTYGVTLRSRF